MRRFISFFHFFYIEYLCGYGEGSQAISMFQNLYENNAYLITAHNLFHAPLSIALLLAITIISGYRYAAVIKSFLMGVAVHSFIDIYTHVDDGPLMLWPFDWSVLFASSISHWNSTHYGYTVLLTEVLVFLYLLFTCCSGIGHK